MAVLPERRQETIFTHAKPFLPNPGTIGVCGTGPGVGTTHLCIALANYLCSKFYSSTAYLELNASREIRALAGKSDTGPCFHHHRVAYYPELTLCHAQKILAGHFKYFVLDFGHPGSHTLPAFLDCDHRLVVGSVSPWKRQQFASFTARFLTNQNGKEVCPLYIGNYMGGKRDIEQQSKTLGARVIPMPYFPNPFQIASSDFGFFEEILRRS